MKKEKQTSLEARILEVVASHKGPNLDTAKLARIIGLEDEKDVKKLGKAIIKLANKSLLQVRRGGVIRPVDIKPVLTEDETPIEIFDESEQASSIEKGAVASEKPFRRGGKEPMTGPLQVNRFGTGFVTVEGRDLDIRVPARWLNTALNGDFVEVSLQGHRGAQEGRIEKVIQRSGNFYTGIIEQIGRDTASIRSDEKSVQVDFWVPFAGLKGAKENDRVVFKLESWENKRGLPKAEIIQVLGQAGTNDAEILSILAEHQFISTFPAEVDKQAILAAIPVEKDDLSGRLDLRDKPVFTIDPIDAKDFDDALHLERLENGTLRVGVHIADVTHYVKVDSALDQEALNRATSVYLVDRVIPMLPEALSNGICSLNPNQDRMAFSCIMDLDENADVLSYQIAETVIHSKYRFSYETAQEVLEGADNPLKDDLLLINELAKKMTNRRMQAGSIDFESPEPRFVLNERKEPIEIIMKERKESNRLIEEFMLLANKTVSIWVEEQRKNESAKQKHGFPFIYRIHDKPNPEKLSALQEFLKPLSIKITDGKKEIHSKDIQAVLLKIKGTPFENIINQLTLRSMAKAEYGPVNIGHFGLNFKYYTHFTSPIRRYPDVLVHRLLKGYLRGEKTYTEAQLAVLGKHCSKKEKDAQTAERDSIKLKQVEYLSKRMGYLFNGVISGVTDNGIYVEMRPTYIEGMVRMSDLTDDFYIYDRERHQLTGKRRGKKYILGQIVRVKVARTDFAQRTIDLILA